MTHPKMGISGFTSLYALQLKVKLFEIKVMAKNVVGDEKF